MSATFNPSLATALDRLRLQLGDTETAEALLEDETYEALLALYADDETKTLRALAESLIARYSNEPSQVSVSKLGVSISWSDRLAAWREIVSRVRAGSLPRTLRPVRDDCGAEYYRECQGYPDM